MIAVRYGAGRFDTFDYHAGHHSPGVNALKVVFDNFARAIAGIRRLSPIIKVYDLGTHLPRFFFRGRALPAIRSAIAIACFSGRPALRSVLMFALIVFWLDPRFRGMTISCA
jgi:hypothetical protein